jgi:hypothetical protein
VVFFAVVMRPKAKKSGCWGACAHVACGSVTFIVPIDLSEEV